MSLLAWPSVYGGFQRLNCCEQNPPQLDLWRQESSFYSVRVQPVNPNPVDVLTPLTWWGVSKSLQTVLGEGLLVFL